MDTAPGIPLASATSGVPSSPAEGESSSSAVTWNSPPGVLSPWPRARPLESLRLGCWSQGSVPDVLMNSWSCQVKRGDREVQEKFLFFLLKILPFLFMGESIYTHTQHHAALNSQGNFPITEISGCSQSGLVSALLLLGPTLFLHIRVCLVFFLLLLLAWPSSQLTLESSLF